MRFAVGNDEEERFVGGVRALDGSFIVVECVEGGRVGSGDKGCGVACGIDVSKISERSSFE